MPSANINTLHCASLTASYLLPEAHFRRITLCIISCTYRLQAGYEMKVDLLFVSARALSRWPNAAPVQTLRTALSRAGRRLQFYQQLPASRPDSPCLLGLSLIGRGTESGYRDFSSLPSLPPIPEFATEQSVAGKDRPLRSMTGNGISSESQPQIPGDGLSDSASAIDLEPDDDFDFDPYALDLKNTPDFDPDQDPDAAFYEESVVHKWIRLDDQQCAQGPKPRLYEWVPVSNKTQAQIYSADYDPSPLVGMNKHSRITNPSGSAMS